jgi:hypothetical protein
MDGCAVCGKPVRAGEGAHTKCVRDQADATLVAELNRRAAAEAAAGEAMFMGKPDRWHDDPHWRCHRGHVSTMFLKSEAVGAALCLAGGCQQKVYLTFPEDQDGPLGADLASIETRGTA